MSLQDHYPTACPFCAIAAAYPPPSSPSATSTSTSSSPPSPSPSTLYIPSEPLNPHTVTPAAYVIYASPSVIAFLDIMPMARGHLLVATRAHVEKVGDLVEDGVVGEIGLILPPLSRAITRTTHCTDYNIVQNNGPAAAQVVPHIHFHIIPRDTHARPLPELQSKSWTMFGRGQRDELDEGEAAELAREMRARLREELRKGGEWRGRL